MLANPINRKYQDEKSREKSPYLGEKANCQNS
jgi:hypothetical protein